MNTYPQLMAAIMAAQPAQKGIFPSGYQGLDKAWLGQAVQGT